MDGLFLRRDIARVHVTPKLKYFSAATVKPLYMAFIKKALFVRISCINFEACLDELINHLDPAVSFADAMQ